MGLVLWYWTIFNGTFRDLQTWRLPFSLFLNADSKKYFFIFRFLISLIVPPIPSNTVLLFKKKETLELIYMVYWKGEENLRAHRYKLMFFPLKLHMTKDLRFLFNNK